MAIAVRFEAATCGQHDKHGGIMAQCTTKAKIEFAYLMAKHSDANLDQLQRLMYFGATYHRLATEACNRELTASEQQKWLRVTNALLKLVGLFGAKLKTQNDPRGCTVKIIVPDGYTNDWGREGICVPTS